MDKERLVRDIYHKGVIFCKPDTPLQEVVRVMAPIGRIVVLESTPETEARIRDLGLEVLIAEGEVVVARATRPGTG